MSRRHIAVFLVQRIGPYHDARLAAWARRGGCRVHAIEFRVDGQIYAWARVNSDGDYVRTETKSAAELVQKLHQLSPDVLVCVGYSDPEIHCAINWAIGRKVALVVCSDSTYSDEPRRWTKEALKRPLIATFDAALVAGSCSSDYMTHLGLPAARHFQPWDVVDNRYFETGAARARANAVAERARLGLPEPYFLCVARFVAKKNLSTLLEAYRLYRDKAGDSAWKLVLSGEGPLAGEIQRTAQRLEINRELVLTGFLQYPDLPALYGLSGALVLPSTSDQWGLVVNEAMAAGVPVLVSSRCGCAADLVAAGENGFVFDPNDAGSLAELLLKVAGGNEDMRRQMGQAARARIGRFSPEAFARGVGEAVTRAVAFRRERQIPWMSRTMVRFAAEKYKRSS